MSLENASLPSMAFVRRNCGGPLLPTTMSLNSVGDPVKQGGSVEFEKEATRCKSEETEGISGVLRGAVETTVNQFIENNTSASCKIKTGPC